MPKNTVKGLILMGGQSSRMGRDKAFVEYKDQTLLDRALSHLKDLTTEVYLSVNATQFEALQGAYKCIQDKYIDKGPMGGILSALEALNQDLIVLAVDMPNAEHSILNGLISTGNKVRAYKNQSNQWEPLPSYWPQTITETLALHFSKNQLSLSSFLHSNGEAVISDTHSDSFKNLNNPSDLP